MSTTDLQRLRQDEWLSALRSGEYVKTTGEMANYYDNSARCALGVGLAVGGLNEELDPYQTVARWLGISTSMMTAVYGRNDGSHSLHEPDAPNPEPHSFDEIADWFKEQRDLWDGDLSNWTPEP